MANRYDNLAYDYSYTTTPKKQTTQNPNIRIKTAQKTKTSAKTKNNYSTLLRVLLFTVFAFFVLTRGVMITDKANELSVKKKELADIKAKNQEMQVDIEKSLDLMRIEQLASEKLNMRRPEKYQIVYINLDRVDYVEKTDASGGFNNATKLFSSIKSYLD